MENRKQIMIGVLSVIVCIMAVGYAYLSQTLTVNGTAHIDSTWNVRITNIVASDIHYATGGAVAHDNPYDATNEPNGTGIVDGGLSARFNASLMQPGDYITYTVTVSNAGTLPAALESFSTVYTYGDNTTSPTGSEEDWILYTISSTRTAGSGIVASAADSSDPENVIPAYYTEIPAANNNVASTIQFTVTATYNGDKQTQPDNVQKTKSLLLTLNFRQDMTPGTPATY